MPLTAILEESAFSTLDESLKPLYQQNTENNQYYLDIAPTEAEKLAFNLQQEKQKLANNNAELLKQKGEINNKVKAFEALGKTPEEIKQLLESNRPEEINKLIEKYESEKLSISKSFEESLSAEKTAREKYQNQLKQTKLDTAIQQVILDFDLDREIAPANLREYLQVVESEDGNISIQVVENGQPALVAGQPKSVEQLLNGFKEQKKLLKMFNAPNGGGTGASNRQGGGHDSAKTMKRSEWETRSRSGENFTEFFAKGGRLVD